MNANQHMAMIHKFITLGKDRWEVEPRALTICLNYRTWTIKFYLFCMEKLLLSVAYLSLGENIILYGAKSFRVSYINKYERSYRLPIRGKFLIQISVLLSILLSHG